jgi:hypothetical protein
MGGRLLHWWAQSKPIRTVAHMHATFSLLGLGLLSPTSKLLKRRPRRRPTRGPASARTSASATLDSPTAPPVQVSKDVGEGRESVGDDEPGGERVGESNQTSDKGDPMPMKYCPSNDKMGADDGFLLTMSQLVAEILDAQTRLPRIRDQVRTPVLEGLDPTYSDAGIASSRSERPRENQVLQLPGGVEDQSGRRGSSFWTSSVTGMLSECEEKSPAEAIGHPLIKRLLTTIRKQLGESMIPAMLLSRSRSRLSEFDRPDTAFACAWGGASSSGSPLLWSSSEGVAPAGTHLIGRRNDREADVMIVDARTLRDGSVVKANLCIMGAGAAGISIAVQLSGGTLSVSIGESGSLKFDKAVQALAAGKQSGVPYFRLATLGPRRAPHGVLAALGLSSCGRVRWSAVTIIWGRRGCPTIYAPVSWMRTARHMC